MRKTALLILLPVPVLCAAQAGLAAPAWGGNCLSCHGQLQTGVLSVFGEDTTADPDESATGAPDRGTLKVFQAYPGQTKSLRVEITGLDADDKYAVELKRLRFPGVESGGQLTHTGDCDWAEWDDPGDHYSDPAIAYRWGAGPTTFAFDIDVTPGTSYDYYDLVFAVAGKFSVGGALFYAEEHFYLETVLAPGDLDADGDVDLDDYVPFAACLNGPGITTPPEGCAAQTFSASDLDTDGDVDANDFAAFQAAFTGS